MAQLAGLSHVMLYAHDVARAAKWYGDTLGFKTRALYGPHYGILFHDPMKLRLDLHPTKRGETTYICRGPIVYFATDDIDAMVAELRSKSVKCEDPRSESGSPRFTSFTDSEGNVLGLTEKSAH